MANVLLGQGVNITKCVALNPNSYHKFSDMLHQVQMDTKKYCPAVSPLIHDTKVRLATDSNKVPMRDYERYELMINIIGFILSHHEVAGSIHDITS